MNGNNNPGKKAHFTTPNKSQTYAFKIFSVTHTLTQKNTHTDKHSQKQLKLA